MIPMRFAKGYVHCKEPCLLQCQTTLTLTKGSVASLRKCSVTRAIVTGEPEISSSQPLDLLFARTSTGQTETLQVVDAGDGGSFTALWKGRMLRLARGQGDSAAAGNWTAEPIGSYPLPGCALLQAFPSLQGRLLEDLHGHAGTPPPTLSSVVRVQSLAELEAAATADASMWCDGTEPGAPGKTELQSQTLTAGELVSLMRGKRGVVIVQLWNGFEPSRGQPVYEPWVIHLLETALSTPGICAVPSVAPGGVGLTAVLYADREPWNVWGPHLASFGCQANVVAGSAYYKVLIGKILGYKDENIFGYVRSVGGGLTPAVVSQVEADLKKLSKAKPKLPWNRQGSRGAKKGQPGSTGSSGSAGSAAASHPAAASPPAAAATDQKAGPGRRGAGLMGGKR